MRADTKCEGFYVFVQNGRQRGLLLGPYETEQDAKRHVDRAQKEAAKIDEWAWFYDMGVTLAQTRKPGSLNRRIGLR